MTRNRLKWLITVLVLLLAGASWTVNQFLLDRILQQEKEDVELWAKAIEFNNTNLDGDPQAVLDFVSTELIIKERTRIPMIVVDESDQIVASRFLDPEDQTPETVETLRRLNPPIPIQIPAGLEDSTMTTQYVLYGESDYIQLVRFVPLFQLGFVLILLGIGWASYQSIMQSEQSNLWVGMAKEAAHQLGTPISGLYGWLALMKEERSSPYVDEMSQDVDRLKHIAERFNKIGSTPERVPTSIKSELEQAIEYMKRRLPKKESSIHLDVDPSTQEALFEAPINRELMQWAFENLMKNALDASNTGAAFQMEILLKPIKAGVQIDFKDYGSGIDKKEWKEVFRPGYSTKKRGWGLGLTLTKRIIEEYHRGSIDVLASEKGKGTTFRVILPCD
jgi:signal transduction histidine kinase